MAQLVTRIDERLVVEIDALVRDGVAASRSDAVRMALEQLIDHHRRQRVGQQIADAYRRSPQTDVETMGPRRCDPAAHRRGALVTTPRQGEIWWAEVETARRPVLVVTRSEAVEVLTGVVVAPITRSIRNIPTEISLGEPEGLLEECVASFDNLQRIRRSSLTERLGELGSRRDEICFAVRAMTDC